MVSLGLQAFQRRKVQIRRPHHTARRCCSRIRIISGPQIICVMLFLIYICTLFSFFPNTSNFLSSETPTSSSSHSTRDETAKNVVLSKNNDDDNGKSFRHYPPRRYYGLPLKVEQQPDFLKKTEYIYGEYPFLLREGSGNMKKLLVDQTEWLEPGVKTLPFADGTNPSILHIDRISHSLPEIYSKLKDEMGVTYLTTICMTNSQCQWKDTPDEIKEYNLSTRESANVVKTVLLLLDSDFQVLQQADIEMERDAPWGNRKIKPQPLNAEKNKFATMTRALDDARLFMHKEKIWVSYRDGKAFGYDKQVLNPLHLESLVLEESENKATIRIKASETVTFCCGRNMALISTNPTQLQSLTWVDPVTVIDVDDTDIGSRQSRRLNDRAKKKPKKSHVHGTNAFMVPFNGDQELLGMAHFHRPSDREANDYARFGHHYTHAFFTITSKAPYRLSRLSAEFVLQSKHHPDDAEIIQFISGLEHHDDDVILAWGINDCEGAVARISTHKVEELLRKVEPGKEVVDYMSPPSQI